MAEVPPGPSSLLPALAPAAPAAAELGCPFLAGAALACCSEDKEDDEEHEGGCGSPAGGEAATMAKARSCLHCSQLAQEQQQQLNGLFGPELRHLRAAATLNSKVLSAAEAAVPDGAPKVTATKGAEGHPGERPLHSVPPAMQELRSRAGQRQRRRWRRRRATLLWPEMDWWRAMSRRNRTSRCGCCLRL